MLAIHTHIEVHTVYTHNTRAESHTHTLRKNNLLAHIIPEQTHANTHTHACTHTHTHTHTQTNRKIINFK